MEAPSLRMPGGGGLLVLAGLGDSCEGALARVGEEQASAPKPSLHWPMRKRERELKAETPEHRRARPEAQVVDRACCVQYRAIPDEA